MCSILFSRKGTDACRTMKICFANTTSRSSRVRRRGSRQRRAWARAFGQREEGLRDVLGERGRQAGSVRGDKAEGGGKPPGEQARPEHRPPSGRHASAGPGPGPGPGGSRARGSAWREGGDSWEGGSAPVLPADAGEHTKRAWCRLRLPPNCICLGRDLHLDAQRENSCFRWLEDSTSQASPPKRFFLLFSFSKIG